MPPKRNADEPSEARIVTELGKEFNIDEVYGSESTIIGSLKSVNDFNPVEVPSNSPLNFDMVMLEDKEPPQGNDDDQPMASGEEDGKVNAKEKSATVKQNEKLYAEEGMLNTKMRKTDEKRRKKKNQPSAMEHDGNDDYDFKVDYTKDSAMETGDEVEDDETKKNRFELPSGVELDNE
ncbi:guanine nucleotide-binding protein-like NSN1 [Salvia miltiorrhiza]|uniref:guanine nucleotide-binding protein-like NSN1 n=1 Tax=Salvia miltiorrhiza TaxID=226208 RepID=UPI0025ABDD86|nr:guanine nucleotide-binding protein-like NSN1 [Salvia miltiorrhiza]XP_057765251.1 guanine nucleotide-binding protein-like NSN1 [Salvia miltiorrhiza]XP_057765252.1 guanine nucleotide-binding protein-like NSN1 [Salvia miltiorrhiza]XP_057765253.1 guanine nucleotide-binding protein-like NSN1 [Salvia miltiorrhiza]XP_057765254.1 guanine nucleotide-binding protein-like NSN1 [Salvia miltiorrhiza]XP_057765255.1 guanine nucleotide-binding protein-like NSN1 [Salvia miltiorrhiza]XP_057765256.1 guanine 